MTDTELHDIAASNGMDFEVVAARHDNGKRGERLLGILAPDADWLDTDDAAQLLCVRRDTLFSGELSQVIRCRSRSRKGKGPRGCGLLWSREDLERVMQIRRCCRIGLAAAARVMAALRDERL